MEIVNSRRFCNMLKSYFGIRVKLESNKLNKSNENSTYLKFPKGK